MPFVKKTPVSASEEAELTQIYPPAIPVDYTLHTEDRPFCGDPTCGCHNDPTLLYPLGEAFYHGLVSIGDVTNIVNGRTI